MNVKKIIFIENRQKTIFWEEIASYLFKQNIEIYWIVQNHNFTPKIGSVYQIPYPMSCDMIKNSKNELFRYTASTDRLVNYFKGGVDHYNYYYDCILANIDHIDPDVIIGEATLFHEIIISKRN